MNSDTIPYGKQWIDEEDIQAVTETLRSSYLTTGPKIREFEEKLSSYTNAKTSVAVSSGTAGLHLAMLAGGIGPGDEVLVPALSFLATANAVLYVGAKPVFVDSMDGEFNLDIEDAARKINSKTKAIVPVHFAGQPVPMDALQILAKKTNSLIVEDAAHALGARLKNRPIGSLSPMTVFSFHPVKQITSGEGGAIAINDSAFEKKLRRLRHHGIDVDVIERDANRQWSYDMVDLGYNYRITDFQAALGISQLKKCEDFLKRRESIANRYNAAFQNHTAWEIPPRPAAEDRHSWHLYILRLRKNINPGLRDGVFRRLRESGIGVHVHYQPIYLHSYYQKLGWKKGTCPKVEETFHRMLTIPIFPAMTDSMVDRVISTVNEVTKEIVK